MVQILYGIVASLLTVAGLSFGAGRFYERLKFKRRKNYKGKVRMRYRKRRRRGL